MHSDIPHQAEEEAKSLAHGIYLGILLLWEGAAMG